MAQPRTKSRLRKVLKQVQKPQTGWMDVSDFVVGKADATILTGIDGIIYVRDPKNGQVLTAYNSIAPTDRPGLQVKVGRLVGESIYRVKGMRDSYGVPAGGGQLSRHTHDGLFIGRDRFLPFLVMPIEGGAHTVQIYGDVIEKADETFGWIENQQLDLSSYVPTAGALYVLIEADDDGVIYVIEGTPIEAKELLTPANIPAKTSGRKASCAVRLYDSQEQLYRDPKSINDFVDVRSLTSGGGGGGGGTEFKGQIDCSANPNYPAADAGDYYRVSVAGKIGGASGTSVQAGDTVLCIADGTASGDQATVGTSWRIDKTVNGPATTGANIAKFSDTSGRILEDAGTIESIIAVAYLLAGNKTTPDDLDRISILDSDDASLKYVYFANLKTWLTTLYVALTGNQTVAGVKTFSSDPIIPDEAYDATAWNGSLEPPTKNAVRDKIETMGAGGGLTYNATTVTTGNVTAVKENFYDCTIAGMTADRDFNLPTPAAAGERIALRVLDGDDTYELIIKANAVELTRIFIANEYMSFVSHGTGAGDWKMEVDGRIPCLGYAERQAAQNINHNTLTKIALDASVIDRGNIVDVTTNDRINIRRAGNYEITGLTSIAGLEGGENLQALTYVNAAEFWRNVMWSSFTGTNNDETTQAGPKLYQAAIDDYVELYIKHNEGTAQNTLTAGRSPGLLVKEIL
jgi:hypothetical protein